jgi:hypothetical protein
MKSNRTTHVRKRVFCAALSEITVNKQGKISRLQIAGRKIEKLTLLPELCGPEEARSTGNGLYFTYDVGSYKVLINAVKVDKSWKLYPYIYFGGYHDAQVNENASLSVKFSDDSLRELIYASSEPCRLTAQKLIETGGAW